jgi:hypothetical protein
MAVQGVASPAQGDILRSERIADIREGFIVVINSDAGAVRRQGPRALRTLAKRTRGSQLAIFRPRRCPSDKTKHYTAEFSNAGA